MNTLQYIAMITAWIAVLYFSGREMIKGLQRISALTGMQSFIVSFIVMATAASLPNLFVGITSVMGGIPQLSFGEIAGGNVVDLTLALAIAALISRNGLSAKGKTARVTAIFAGLAGLLPFILAFDGYLTRADGVILIGAFVFYLAWIFGKKERFEKVYSSDGLPKPKKKGILKEWARVAAATAVLLVAANGIVVSATAISLSWGVAVGFIGILIVGLGNALPEMYMAAAAARKGKDDIVLGDLLGSVITPSLFVLGLVAIIHPFGIRDASSFFITRIFMAAAAAFSVFFIWTDKRITKKEGILLLLLYVAFISFEVFNKIAIPPFLVTVIFMVLALFFGYTIGRVGHIFGGHFKSPHHWIYGAVMIIAAIPFVPMFFAPLVSLFGAGLFISDLKDFLELKFYGADDVEEKRFWGID